ncbi:MAG: NAD(+)/NADH kinase [Deltaproteobacteria bacterium]|nr:NAD(+)/NADH kinase [Deltaproteobacteria bacterium]
MIQSIGIIANPASGKDIRRLVAYGSVFGNHEKINIIRRLLMALDAMMVPKVYIMADPTGMGLRALDDVDVSLEVKILDMPISGTQDDSTRAAGQMHKLGVGCIITLGGDGTNRVVAKGCKDTPLLPISTGTNNVFPRMVEGTLAGLAAGIVARKSVPISQACVRMPKLELFRNGEMADIALVDLLALEAGFVGTRAIWDESTVREIFLTRANPADIGFSAVGGHLNPLNPDSGQALHITTGPGEYKVQAPIAPGLIRWLPIQNHRLFDPSTVIHIARGADLVSLDGEREVTIGKDDHMTVRLNLEGPLLVNMERVLAKAAEMGQFLEKQCPG